MSRSSDGCEVGGPVGRVVGVADRWRAGCSLLAPRDVSGRVVGVLGRCLTTRTRGGGGVSVEQALSAAGFLDTAGVRVLAPALVYWSTVLRYRERVLRLLGRLGRRGICQVVVPCVRRELSTPVEPDWWDYRCHAGILYHFGLYDEVAWVAERALASEDPEVREVGQDEVERLLDLDDGQRPPRGCPGALPGGAARQGARSEDVPVGGADAGGLGHDGAWTAARRPGPRAGRHEQGRPMSTRRTFDQVAPVGELGSEEFYDEDDLEELDGSAGAGALASFDQDAIGEDEEAQELTRRQRASRGGQDDPYVVGGERLAKVMAHVGVASRRASEAMITAGRVSVDGVTVREPGMRVDPASQEIRVDGSRLLADPDVLTVMLHKPAGVVTTMEDPQGRPTVAGLAERYLDEHAQELGVRERPRLVHVGRLDTQTEGLLLLSNDGELSHRLTHPSYEIAKTYVAIVEGRVAPWVPRKLRRGIELEDGPARADRVVVKEAGPRRSIVEITLHSGRNRVVRRMLAAVGHPVVRLSRTRLGPLTLAGLRPGQVRALTSQEVVSLQREVGL